MFNKNPYEEAQIRLTLKYDWVKTLDQICDSRNMSRLALIRLYLESGMQKDLYEVAQRKKLKQELQDKGNRHRTHTF